MELIEKEIKTDFGYAKMSVVKDEGVFQGYLDKIVSYKRGCGHEIMKIVLEWFYQQKVDEILLQITPLGDVSADKLVKFYKKEGFEVIARSGRMTKEYLEFIVKENFKNFAGFYRGYIPIPPARLTIL